MQTLKTSTRAALALLALTAACGGPAPRPVSVYFSAPPAAPSPVPLTASSAAPRIVGGTYLVGVFQAQRTIQGLMTGVWGLRGGRPPTAGHL